MRCLSLHRTDLTASLVVFLVALLLCVGVAVASGVPAELGLITGIVGGLAAAALPGSSLHVSGPAAGLTVLVHEAVRRYGVGALGVLVLAAGLVQGDAGLVGAVGGGGLAVVAVGVGTVAVLVGWPRWRAAARVAPAPLVAVALAAVVTAVLDLPVRRVEVHGLLDAVRRRRLHSFARPAEVGVVGTVLAFALIASAESLFSATAVDRLHDGPRTDYDKELIAQGAGNVVCGALGALPMTAVIVRSAANVRAWARTKASRVLHGVWLLVFVAAVPAALSG
ncbi:hypothetical protein GCM10010346_38220 [Streptomyces chryseus]|uniref:SLC26A/SulP transporter domain-containing protein n=2 Tax=Streptomyces chryseus TaxID=68186 RepID=A0ABQ3DQ27_9ACTN|nr:hypothetical protein GCM10010346_38220 [Streptomyces chryseus]